MSEATEADDGADGAEVPVGATGELVIGGVGLARYLDVERDAQRYAPLEALGWERAYRTGDLVVHDPGGLLFVGRADDQVKLGGRRIELGEVDAALLALPGVAAAASAVQRAPSGLELLVGYVVGDGLDLAAATASLRRSLPSALVPVLVAVDGIPVRTSGKVDRAAVAEAIRLAGAGPVIETMAEGLDTEVGDEGGLLSGGQRQLVALARALLRRPALLVLDEPTSELDRDLTPNVLEALRELKWRPSVLLISHDPAVLSRADRVVQVEAGVASEELLGAPARR